MKRQSVGNAELDAALGGGLLPGTLTVIVGATGVGKSQLGISWAHASAESGVPRVALLDLSSRGDSQNHRDYAARMRHWELRQAQLQRVAPDQLFATDYAPGEILSLIGYEGKRVLRSQMDAEQWDAWQSELNRRLPILEQFVYAHLVRGTRRFLLDGIEPLEHPEDSLQLDLVELIYHRMLRKEHDWLARELLRQDYRRFETEVATNVYDHHESAAVALVTTRESMLEQLMTKPLAEGDLAAGANTIILMGRVLHQGRMGRGLYIAKHRGSVCDDRILPFTIGDKGLELQG